MVMMETPGKYNFIYALPLNTIFVYSYTFSSDTTKKYMNHEAINVRPEGVRAVLLIYLIGHSPL